jgi:hypothetical protein
MMQARRISFLLLTLLLTATLQGQGQRGAGGAPQGAPPAGGRGAGGRGVGPVQPPPKALIPDAKPVRTCESLMSVSLPNTTIESAIVDPANAGICRVTAVTTHPPAGDKVRIWVAIPTANWNGRFMGNGGGGFSGGSAGAVNGPVAQGYAAGSTDTGHEGGSGSFALGADGKLNWQLIRDNGHVGIHEMTVTGKALTQAMYGVAPRYSYFNGCSTGGRQGLMEVQRYPQDYNGVMSGAPAINWNRLHVQQLWGSVVMNMENNPVPVCKQTAATNAAIASCDALDGVTDGVIEDPNRCMFDPKALVGTSAGGECGTFTEADANVIRRLWEGPRRKDGSFLWVGLPKGAPLNSISPVSGNPPRPQAFGISLEWFRYFLTQNPQFDWTTITYDSYERLFDQSVEQFGAVIGTDNPDLTEFKNRGGKSIVWHGWADPLISAEGTIDYYKRVTQTMGGPQRTSEFMRLFLAPGVGHCAGGSGPAPTGQMEALLAWVEEGRAPETLTATRNAAGVTRTRPLCQYPLVARYRGTGSTDDAANFTCSTGF